MGAIATKSIPVAAHQAPYPTGSTVAHSVKAADLARLVILAAGATASWRGISPRFDGIEPLSLAAALMGGYPVFCEAVDNWVGDVGVKITPPGSPPNSLQTGH